MKMSHVRLGPWVVKKIEPKGLFGPLDPPAIFGDFSKIPFQAIFGQVEGITHQISVWGAENLLDYV